MTDATVGAISYQFKADVSGLKASLAEMKTGIKGASDEIKSKMSDASRSLSEFSSSAERTAAKIKQYGETIGNAAYEFGPWTGAHVQAAQVVGTVLAQAVARANLAVKALAIGLGVAGVAAAGMAAMVFGSRESIKELGELEQAAKLAGVSLSQLQNLQRAAVQSGGSRDGMATALQGIAKAANDASRDENEFSKIIAANNIKLMDNQGHLRSTMSLMSDYANLIKNAKTEQDKLVLMSAIGAGENMLRFFEQGADKIKQIADEAGKAGNAIDDGMVRRAGEFDRAWESAMDNFKTGWKSAVMTIVGWFDWLEKTARNSLNNLGTGGIWKQYNDLMRKHGLMSDNVGVITTDHGALETGAPAKTVELPPVDVDGGKRKKTVIPTDDKGSGASKATKEAKDAVERYLDSQKKALATVQAEAETWNKSNVERAEAVSLARAQAAAEADGKKLTDQQAEEAKRYGREIQSIKDRTAQLTEMSNAMSETFANGLDQLIVKGGKLNDIMQNLSQTLMSAALKGALTGEGMFGGMFGGAPGSGGLLGGLTKGMAGLFDGFRADGGSVSGGRAYVVGENGPELFMPAGGGSIVPNGAGGGATVNVHNYAGAQIETRTTRGSNNQQQIEVMVRQIIHGDLANNGGIARALQNTYGMSRSTGRG